MTETMRSAYESVLRETRANIWTAIHRERQDAIDRVWQRIQKEATLPDNLNESVGISWLALIHIVDEEKAYRLRPKVTP